MSRLPLFLMPIIIVLSGPMIVVASATPSQDDIRLVVSGWGRAASDRVETAGGHVIGPVRAPFGILAQSNDPEFSNRLHALGAWAVIEGGRIASICGVDL